MNTPPEFDIPSARAPGSGGPPRAVPTRRSGRSRPVSVMLALLSALIILAACSTSGDDASETTSETITPESGDEGDEGGENGDDVIDGPDDEVTTTTADLPPPADPDREPTAFERTYITDLAEQMDVAFDSNDQIDTECLATAWVLPIGGDRLQAADLEAEDLMFFGPGGLDLDRDTARSMHRLGIECGLTTEQFSTAVVPDLAGCPEGELTDEDFEAIMIAAYTDEFDDELEERLEEIGDACIGE